MKASRAARPACELACRREANLNRRETAAGAGTMGAHRARIHSMEWAPADENKKKKAGRKNQTVGGPRSTARAITV